MKTSQVEGFIPKSALLYIGSQLQNSAAFQLILEMCIILKESGYNIMHRNFNPQTKPDVFILFLEVKRKVYLK